MAVIRYQTMITVMMFILFITACATDDVDDASDTEEETADSEDETNGTKEDNSEVDSDTLDERTVIAENLDEPWEVQLHEGIFYISERTGNIVTIQNGDETRKPVELDQNLSNQPEAGLLGFALPGDFDETSTAFAYYSYEEAGDYFQRVVTVEETEAAWVETEVLLDDIPGGQVHQGGRIQIGPDNRLYITTGDAAIPDLAQDLDSLAGKILRMEIDGSIPDDNPFDDSYVYSYGHRNPQGLAWSPDGELYATEHGAEALDEINQIIAGNNYGWPVIEGDEQEEGMEAPLLHSGNDTWAPSGMAFSGDSFYFAALRGESVRRFDPVAETEEEIVSDDGRIRDVLAAENGIYFITNNTDGRGNPDEADDRLIFEPRPGNQVQ